MAAVPHPILQSQQWRWCYGEEQQCVASIPCMQLAVPVSPRARAAQGTVSSFTAAAKRPHARDKGVTLSQACSQGLEAALLQSWGPAEAQPSCSFPFVPTLGPPSINVCWSRNILSASRIYSLSNAERKQPNHTRY